MILRLIEGVCVLMSFFFSTRAFFFRYAVWVWTSAVLSICDLMNVYQCVGETDRAEAGQRG